MLEKILALAVMLLAASGTGVLAHRMKIPYTVLLVPTGILLILLAQFSTFAFVGSITMTPELLFYAFLPVLVFEAAYNINWKRFLKSKWSILLLAVPSLLVSAAVVAVGLKYGLALVGWEVPWQVAILFGALISATDPVAVLALFKDYGAPKRLALIFEGESLFNDGTGLALFLVLMSLFVTGGGVTASAIGGGTLLFLSMIVLGVVLGGAIGVAFSKLIEKIRDNSALEMTLALVMAHVTFISAELLSHWMMHTMHWMVGISPIIATTMGAIVIGNWGRYKISPRVHHFMEDTLGYLAFVVNSIIFILIGFVFIDLSHEIDISLLLIPGAVAIVVVALARIVSVYPLVALFNKTKVEERIPRHWQHLLAWGSLRGAIAIAIVLMLQHDTAYASWAPAGWDYPFSPQVFIAGITIFCIYFTLFIKATTIGVMLEKFQLTKMTPIEYAGYLLARGRIAVHALSEVERFVRRGYIDEHLAAKARKGYTEWQSRAAMHMKETFAKSPDTPLLALHLFVTGIEAQTLHRLYRYEEINELVYRRLMDEVDDRIIELETGNVPMIPTQCEIAFTWYDRLETLMTKDDALHNHYLYARARSIAASKVIEALAHLAQTEHQFTSDDIATFIEQYTARQTAALAHLTELTRHNTAHIAQLQIQHLEGGLMKAKERELEEIIEEGLLAPKAAQKLSARIGLMRTKDE